MKYTKAELEIIALDNIDIVTASDYVPPEIQEIIDIICPKGNSGWQNACWPSNKKHYEEVEKRT